jgi:hypothetical protein
MELYIVAVDVFVRGLDALRPAAQPAMARLLVFET